MGIRRDVSKDRQQAKIRARKERHLIDSYSVSRSWIVCDCAWAGPEDEFQPHRKEMGATRSGKTVGSL